MDEMFNIEDEAMKYAKEIAYEFGQYDPDERIIDAFIEGYYFCNRTESNNH